MKLIQDWREKSLSPGRGSAPGRAQPALPRSHTALQQGGHGRTRCGHVREGGQGPQKPGDRAAWQPLRAGGVWLIPRQWEGAGWRQLCNLESHWCLFCFDRSQNLTWQDMRWRICLQTSKTFSLLNSWAFCILKFFWLMISWWSGFCSQSLLGAFKGTCFEERPCQVFSLAAFKSCHGMASIKKIFPFSSPQGGKLSAQVIICMKHCTPLWFDIRQMGKAKV